MREKRFIKHQKSGPNIVVRVPLPLLVTRLPVQEWAISWAMTLARDLSPARRVGVAKVRLEAIV